MSLISRFFSAVFGASKRLSCLEKAILDSVRSSLPAAALALWDMQVQSINKVQRLPGGVEVNFYRIRNGHPVVPVELAFPNEADELHLATVSISSATTDERLEARVWSVKGILFMITYQGSVDYFEEAAGSEGAVELRLECQILADVLHPSFEGD
jgi:hypothetical protein